MTGEDLSAGAFKKFDVCDSLMDPRYLPVAGVERLVYGMLTRRDHMMIESLNWESVSDYAPARNQYDVWMIVAQPHPADFYSRSSGQQHNSHFITLAIERASTLILARRDHQKYEQRGINAGLADGAEACIIEEVISIPVFASGNTVY
ncbi:hypothetical protein P691DRAFT_765030 [Macrolepiota fuliginosa MF-IS2]|uniref:Uncharacterized protein n=1 Tax=Macrolepiota fuliginosa MF-IS2 TaxID=1400762 RepID=A0A9P6BYK9_9AGAR|nr:hypothetical protein P691DRAFT_765030 [Macrolepiota fuliginosa MF-IS2]